ncbi:MAG TPA: hypothetical protein DEP66_04070 [Acidimicrobiaceae bacterium]|nr:hypothetical protein [Acidimicrobiaceae bacterium]
MIPAISATAGAAGAPSAAGVPGTPAEPTPGRLPSWWTTPTPISAIQRGASPAADVAAETSPSRSARSSRGRSETRPPPGRRDGSSTGGISGGALPSAALSSAALHGTSSGSLAASSATSSGCPSSSTQVRRPSHRMLDGR